jgi:hypothetical protein
MRIILSTLVAVVALLNVGSAAGSVAGRWRADVPAPGGGTATEQLDLTVKGDTVTGTLTNAVGGVGQLHEGHWDGTTLRFWTPWDPGRLEATGTLQGTTLRMDFKTPQWRATRLFRLVDGK